MNEEYRRGMEAAWRLVMDSYTLHQAEDAIRAVVDDGMSVEEVLEKMKTNRAKDGQS